MSADAALERLAGRLQRGQALAEALMTLTFAPMEPSGVTTVDRVEVQEYVQHLDTPGKIQGGSATTADTATGFVTVGTVRRPILRGGLHLPISADLPVAGDRGVGWEYVCTAVGACDDPTLLNRRYLVVNVPAKSFATARRLDVVELP